MSSKNLILFFVIFIILIICDNEKFVRGKEIQFHTKNVSITESHRLYIREMALEAWAAYEKYAWGQDALKPSTKRSINLDFGPNSGHTIVSGK